MDTVWIWVDDVGVRWPEEVEGDLHVPVDVFGRGDGEYQLMLPIAVAEQMGRSLRRAHRYFRRKQRALKWAEWLRAMASRIAGKVGG